VKSTAGRLLTSASLPPSLSSSLGPRGRDRPCRRRGVEGRAVCGVDGPVAAALGPGEGGGVRREGGREGGRICGYECMCRCLYRDSNRKEDMEKYGTKGE